jgi:hypothetical protein
VLLEDRHDVEVQDSETAGATRQGRRSGVDLQPCRVPSACPIAGLVRPSHEAYAGLANLLIRTADRFVADLFPTHFCFAASPTRRRMRRSREEGGRDQPRGRERSRYGQARSGRRQPGVVAMPLVGAHTLVFCGTLSVHVWARQGYGEAIRVRWRESGI